MGILACVFGPGAALPYWSVDVVRNLVDVCVGPAVYLHPQNIEEIRNALIDRGDRSVIYFCETPAAEIVALFSRLNTPILMIHEDLADVAGFNLQVRSLSLFDSVRLAVQSAASLHDLYFHPQAQVFRRTELTTIGDFIGLLAQAYQIEADAAARNQIASRVVGQAAQPADVSIEDALRSRYEMMRPPGGYMEDVIRASEPGVIHMLQQYGSASEGRRLDSVTWPASVFFNGDVPNTFAPPRQELTGKARILVYGPYLSVPRGKWKAKIGFIIGQNLSGNTLVVDMALNAIPAAICEVKLPHSGQYEIDLAVEVLEPSAPIEVRITLKHGAIEGWFSLLWVEMQRTGAA